MIPAIEQSYPQTEIAQASYSLQKKVETCQAVVVGVNRFPSNDERPVETLRIGEEAGRAQVAKLRDLRARRDHFAVVGASPNFGRRPGEPAT